MKLKSCHLFISSLIIGLSLLSSFTLHSNNTVKDLTIENKHTYAWKGTINSKINVWIQYSISGKLLEGEIIYVNTPKKIPIKLIGTVQEDKSYRLLEFDKTGNITGIITGIPKQNRFTGTWFAPKTRKELSISLTSSKSKLTNTALSPSSNIFGEYYYQYGKGGYNGTLRINKVGASKLAFDIFSTTGEPANNMAIVERDTIATIGSQFIYTIPDSDCRFKVAFYEGFAFVSYTNGYCEGQFGHNASINGIFLKVK